MKHPHSHFDFWPNPHQSRHFVPIPDGKIFKNSQWIVLNRKHAELMVHDKDILEPMTQAPYDNEHYASTFLGLRNLHHEIVKQDTTLTFWPKKHKSHPHTFENFHKDAHFQELVSMIKSKQRLFLRKVAKGCDLSPLKPYISCIP